MEQKTLTNSGKENISGIEVEFTATQNLLKKEVSLNAYIKKSDEQVGVLMYKDGDQFYHTYSNPTSVSKDQKVAVFAFLLEKIEENKEELNTLTK